VVEASLNSGSLITARLALEQNARCLAIAGASIPNTPRPKRRHQLLRQARICVETVQDVLDVLKLPLKAGIAAAEGLAEPAPDRVRSGAPEYQNGQAIGFVSSPVWLSSRNALSCLILELAGHVISKNTPRILTPLNFNTLTRLSPARATATVIALYWSGAG